MNMLVSIIVPVYNIKDYLEDCIVSIIAQDYSAKELILVDDGSTDGSEKMCDFYASSYPWIKAIHQPNGGLSAARNSGMQHANGKYLLFVDGDDYIHENLVSLLVGLATSYEADIVVCNYKKVTQKQLLPYDVKYAHETKIFTGLEGTKALLYQKGMTTSAWGKLFRRELFQDITFPVGKLHEDMGTVYKVFLRASKIVLAPPQRKLYGYVQHGKSIIHLGFTPQKMDYIDFTEQIIYQFNNEFPSLVNSACSRHFSACFEVLSTISSGTYTHEAERLKQEIKKYQGIVLCDANARLKNRIAALLCHININIAISICRLGYRYF